MSIEITINDLEMNTNTPDADGAYWYITDWSGWDSPELRQATLDPSLQEGTIVVESRYGARLIEVTGLCKAVGETGYWLAYNKIINLVTPLDSVEFVVHETTPKFVTVRRAGKTLVKELYGSAFEFNLSLIAPDPAKYPWTG